MYKVNGSTGATEWTLGGKASGFRQARGTTFAWQHDARVLPDGTITLFDDGAAPAVHTQSDGIGIKVDTKHRTASLVHDYHRTPKLLSSSQGNVQTLPNGDVLIGWGSNPVMTEFSLHGSMLWDAQLSAGNNSYRAYRLPWSGTPAAPPTIAASTDGKGTATIYASWNGATAVQSWQVLAGPNAQSLAPVGGPVTKRGFETKLGAKTTQAVVAVQARDAKGTVLGTSPAIAPKR